MIYDSYHNKPLLRHLTGDEKIFKFKKNSRVSVDTSNYSEITIDIYGKIKNGDGKITVSAISDGNSEECLLRFSSTTIQKKTLYFKNANGISKVSFSKGYNTIGEVEISRIIINSSTEKKIVPVSKLDVCFVVPYNIYGGGEIYIKNIIKFGSFNDYRLHFIFLKPNKLKDEMKDVEGVSFYNVETSNDIVKIIKEKNIKLSIFYNSIKAYNLLLEAKRATGIKLVEIYHSDFTWDDSMSKLRERDVDCLIKVSEEVGLHCLAKKVEICRVPINTDIFIPKHNSFSNKIFDIEPGSIGVITRMSKEKNLNYIIDLAKQSNDTKFYIVGDGPARHSFEKDIKKNDVNNVFVLGWVEDVSSIINSFSATILPSKREGTPISILESMACNIPSFCFKSGGIPFLMNGGAFELSLIPEIDIYNILEESRQPVYTRDFIVKNFSATKNAQIFEGIIDSILMMDFEAKKDDSIIIKGGFYA